MNIAKELLKEHSKLQAHKIARYASQNEKNFKELMQCYLAHNYLLAQRAAWSVSIAGRMRPALIIPHLKNLVEILSRKDVHNAVIRNSVRLLETIEIPSKYQGKVMHVCFKFLESYSTPAAIKAFSMTILFNLSKQYPEIGSELRDIIADRWEHESPAFKSRGRKILLQIKKGNSVAANELRTVGV